MAIGACASTSNQALEKRIASLEAELAQLKQQDSLRVKKIEVVDAEGRPRILIGQARDKETNRLQTGMVVMDEEGDRRVGMGMDEDGAAGFGIRHMDGSRRFAAVALPEGDAGFGLFDAAGILRILMAVDTHNDAVAIVRNEEGKIVRELNSGKE
jgi:hypothetical protein